MSLFGLGVLATSVIIAMLVSHALAIMHSQNAALNDTLAYENMAYVEAFAYSGSIFEKTGYNSSVLYADLSGSASIDGIRITQESGGLLIQTYSSPYAVSFIRAEK
jgi:Tfp pilus assembly protein PilV